LSRLATSFVLAYHGCDRSIANRAINGDINLLHSDRDFDWLGPGAYFWESDPQRALEWSQWKASRGDFSVPYVIGAVIDLRNCLDLVTREDLELLKEAQRSFLRMQKLAGLPVPKNRSAPGQPNSDRVLRFLDCAVLRHLHSILEAQPLDNRIIDPFDTVRGMFIEGERLYPGSGFRQKNHVQLAVRNNDCIRGLFIPRPYPT
jgi:hypothetical protein